MPDNASFGNYGSGPQNTAAGHGPQSNLNGAGTQNNYYGPIQDPQAAETKKLREEKEDCLRSLSFPNMHARRQNIEDAHANTCDWLFSTAEFKKWRYRDDLPTNNGVLWIKGKPGAGKSTLMNHTLSYCEEAFGDHLIVAYFFNARGGVLEKTPPGMMRSIVYQLLKKEDTLHNSFLTYYREKRMMNSEGTLQWEQSELKHFIQTIAKQPQLQSKPLLLLVDALDECDEKDVRGVVDFLQTLSVNAVRFSVELRICLSSRHYPSVSMRRHLELIVERRQEHREDIAIYVEEKLYTENERIKDQVREKANGIFMWVVLVVAMLNKAYDEGRDEAMQKTLDEVPEDLEGVFKTLLERGDSDKAELINMLQWVLFSGRPLTPGELYMATVSESLPSYEVVRRRITSSSRGLIEVRRGDVGEEFVQFIHLSVNDFLYRIKRLETLDPTLEPDAISASHARLWAYCWSCIKPLSTTSTNSELLMGPLTSHQFLQYAADYMVYHADKALLNDTAGRRFDREIAQWLAAHDNWLQWLESAGCFKGPGGRCVVGCVGENSNARLIYALAHARYRNLVKFAVTNDASVSSPVGLYGNAVQTAAWFGYYETIEILLEKGADINAQYGFFGNALQTASSCGHYKIAKLLLENGADVNAQGGSYGTALQAASHSKRYELVKLLLENGADVNVRGGHYSTALQAASYSGSYELVKLLLENGADVNARGGYYSTALQAASHSRRYELVKLLLENGADVNVRGGFYGTALQAASDSGSYELVKLLLENGADVNAQGGYYGTALQAAFASWKGRDVVDLLLERGAER